MYSNAPFNACFYFPRRSYGHCRSQCRQPGESTHPTPQSSDLKSVETSNVSDFMNYQVEISHPGTLSTVTTLHVLPEVTASVSLTNTQSYIKSVCRVTPPKTTPPKTKAAKVDECGNFSKNSIKINENTMTQNPGSCHFWS